VTEFFHKVLNPVAILMLFVLFYALIVHGYGWYHDRAGPYLVPILWFFLAVLALIAWIILVFY